MSQKSDPPNTSHARVAGPRSTMSPNDIVQESPLEADFIRNADAQPYACEECNARFATIGKKKSTLSLLCICCQWLMCHSKHKNGHLKPYNCPAPECPKKFSQKQSLDRHHEACHRESPIPAKYYHCTTQGCKYSSSGSARKRFSREDHVKMHIKDYGHYGPASPPDRRRRPLDKAGQGIILSEFQVEALYEEWSPANHSQPVEQSQRTVKRCVFNSLKTNLWYKDDLGEFYARGEPESPNSLVFHCENAGCYFNIRPPEGGSPIAFRSSQSLLDHYRQAHISFYQASISAQPFQRSTSDPESNLVSAGVLLLPDSFNGESVSPDLLHSQYSPTSSTEQPWSSHSLRCGVNTSGDDNVKHCTPPQTFDYFSCLPMDLHLSGETGIPKPLSDISELSNLARDNGGLEEVQSDRETTSYTSSPNQFTFQSHYSETDDRASIFSESIESPPESVGSVFSRRSTSSFVSSRQISHNLLNDDLTDNCFRNPSLCNYCQMSFTRKADRERHEKTRHILSPTYRCTICQRAFVRKDKFFEHSRKHGESLSEKGSVKTLSPPDSLGSQAPILDYPVGDYDPVLGDAAFVEL